MYVCKDAYVYVLSVVVDMFNMFGPSVLDVAKQLLFTALLSITHIQSLFCNSPLSVNGFLYVD